ncbi:DUF488 family protein [Ferrovibrio sp.]|uniref:DUF488 domain-containing protein n=1 Tax=Ferrovibrio sp. TaxID=1917215 RepID=UPI0035B33261
MQIYSIGHSNHPAERFADLLRRHGIRQLADLRSKPASRYVPQFNRAALQALLDRAGIDYRWFGESLGGKPRAVEPDFQHGIAALIDWAAQGPTVMMCAEADPRHCHRTHLVTPALLLRGVSVVHIQADGALLPHDALQHEKIAARPQLDLFS